MTKWLHRNGFSYRKSIGIPHKFIAEAQQVFVETYNKLKQKAGDYEPILFINGVHPTQAIKLAYGQIPAGHVFNMLISVKTYRAYKPGIKEQIVDLAMNNAGIRDTARALHININAVVRALKNFRPVVLQLFHWIN